MIICKIEGLNILDVQAQAKSIKGKAMEWIEVTAKQGKERPETLTATRDFPMDAHGEYDVEAVFTRRDGRTSLRLTKILA